MSSVSQPNDDSNSHRAVPATPTASPAPSPPPPGYRPDWASGGGPGVPVPPALPVELASFGQRAVGFVVDSVLVLVGGSVVAPGGHGDVGVLVVVCLLQWMQSATGATVGKLFVGVRLVRAGSHARVGFGRCLLRWVAHWLDAVPLGAGFLAPLVTRRRQTFADMIVQTIVVRRQS